MKFKLPHIKIDSQAIQNFTKKIFQDKYEKVLQDLEELEQENPDDMRIKQKIAEVLFKKNKIEESIAKYKEVLENYEQNSFILKAIAICKNILKINPGLVDYNLKLAALNLKIGLKNEAANQFRIAINHYASIGESDKTIRLSQELVKIDPSNENRAKLAEIYQNFGMTDEAVKQYEILAKNYRLKKQYDKLLHFYELLLPHKQDKKGVLKDVCILNLRRQNPQRALRIMDQYGVADHQDFTELAQKARMMLEMLKKDKAKR